MKNKKIFLILFLMGVTLFQVGCGAKVTEINSDSNIETESSAEIVAEDLSMYDEEIRRAVEQGIVTIDELADLEKVVTSGEFNEGLARVINLIDSTKVTDWNDAIRDATEDTQMDTDGGRIAVYMAACTLGRGTTTNGDWNKIHMQMETTNGGWEHVESLEIYQQQYDTSPFQDIEAIQRVAGWDYVTAARFYCYGQFSRVSGKSIFEYNRNGELTSNKPLTKEIATRALLRFYESLLEPNTEIAESEELQNILNEAEDKKNNILNMHSSIVKSTSFEQGKTYTGNAYYVSNEGSDSNSGLSPEEAWCSLDKVNQVNLSSGDAVFFERGDIWYGQLWGQEGVTYSAYGEGNKPLFSGAKQDGSLIDSWSLHFEDADGKKIWRYKEDIGDVIGIFFDNGKKYATKVLPYWNGNEYLNQKGDTFILENHLSEDLTFFSALDLAGSSADVYIEDSHYTGTLYLRCDGGNPAEVFENVQIASEFSGFSPIDDESYCTVDNLAFYYYGLPVSCGGYQGSTHNLIQNCEIAYSGGILQAYSDIGGLGIGRPDFAGGAVHIAGSYQTAKNNYIHDCDNFTFVLANHYREGIDLLYQNVTIAENVIEHCGTALHAVDYAENDSNGQYQGSFKDIVFTDNMVLYTGFGWFENKIDIGDPYKEGAVSSSVEFGGAAFLNPGNQGIYIKNNTFCLAKHALVHCYMDTTNFPVFDGNTYVQQEERWLATVRGYQLSISENAKEYGDEYLNDKNGTYIVVP